MKKLLRNSAALALLAICSSSLSSCGKMGFEFWSSFGAAYTTYLDQIVKDINEETGYDLKHRSKGSYDGIRTAVNSARATKHHPSLMTGYPDHFADYISGKILVNLNSYIDAYNAKNGGNLLDDYYPDYMTENMELDIIQGADGSVTKAISALPFNKSTELMGYNGTFVTYCATIEQSLGEVPTTWQEWKVKGAQYRDILMDLVKQTNKDGSKVEKYGKVLYFNQEEDGTAKDFVLYEPKTDAENKAKFDPAAYQRSAGLDFRDVDSKETRVIGWDSTDNMFITLLRQWNSEYTSLPEEEKLKAPRRRKGHIRFIENTTKDEAGKTNLEKTLECLQYFNEMNHDKIFGTPATFGASYCSKAFEANKCMFMLCSSGGLSYNTGFWEKRFRVAPLPYYDDGTTVRKFVISQGANVALSNQGGEEMIQKGFDVMVKLTQGDYQARWCLNTGYYPCSKSATESEIYQEFLNDKSYDDSIIVAYREGSVINQDHYMNADEKWTKFVDPAFMGSSDIRLKIKDIFTLVFNEVKLNDDYTISSSATNTYENILNTVCKEFDNVTSIVVDK